MRSDGRGDPVGGWSEGDLFRTAVRRCLSWGFVRFPPARAVTPLAAGGNLADATPRLHHHLHHAVAARVARSYAVALRSFRAAVLSGRGTVARPTPLVWFGLFRVVGRRRSTTHLTLSEQMFMSVHALPFRSVKSPPAEFWADGRVARQRHQRWGADMRGARMDCGVADQRFAEPHSGKPTPTGRESDFRLTMGHGRRQSNQISRGPVEALRESDGGRVRTRKLIVTVIDRAAHNLSRGPWGPI
jgi:hypothetical protein